MMISFTEYLNRYHGRPLPFLIIGSGGSLRSELPAIRKYIKKHRPITIGINNMTSRVIPDYHLWTNKERFTNFGNCIHPLSKVLCGVGLPESLISIHHNGNYTQIEYERKATKESSLKCINGRIYGYLRTAGCLAIMVAHLLKASSIHVVGMDGFTLHKKSELNDRDQNQHCYGAGHTDDYSWEDSINKDNEIYYSLRSLANYGIDFKILTDTIYSDFYHPELLSEFVHD